MKILDENFNVVAEVQTQRSRCAKTTLFRVVRRIGDAPKPKMIIGMDIISNGDFAFTNKEGKSQFSFRFPTEGHVDFETM